MTENKCGLIINVSSGGGLKYLFNVAYGVGKAACDRMAADCAIELKPHNVAMISLWPGAVRTEKVQEMVLGKKNNLINPDYAESNFSNQPIEIYVLYIYINFFEIDISVSFCKL